MTSDNKKEPITVFFYGLFMDASILKSLEIEVKNIIKVQLNDYRLHIGEKATLIPMKNCTSYGLIMDIDKQEVRRLYQMKGVEEYKPKVLEVQCEDGQVIEAVTYLLPERLLSGCNSDYAKKLAMVARSVGLPDDALKDIESWI